MSEKVNKLFLAIDTFMQEMHLKQPGFTNNVSEPFTKEQLLVNYYLIKQLILLKILNMIDVSKILLQ